MVEDAPSLRKSAPSGSESQVWQAASVIPETVSQPSSASAECDGQASACSPGLWQTGFPNAVFSCAHADTRRETR